MAAAAVVGAQGLMAAQAPLEALPAAVQAQSELLPLGVLVDHLLVDQQGRAALEEGVGLLVWLAVLVVEQAAQQGIIL
jgi:hypothetical protein